MILVDTSVWIDHFRKNNSHLNELLMRGEVISHSFVIGEIACGHLKKRKEILESLQTLFLAPKVADEEVLFCIERYRLMQQGIGLIDVHLLASALISSSLLWTADKKLEKVAKQLKVSYTI